MMFSVISSFYLIFLKNVAFGRETLVTHVFIMLLTLVCLQRQIIPASKCYIVMRRVTNIDLKYPDFISNLMIFVLREF